MAATTGFDDIKKSKADKDDQLQTLTIKSQLMMLQPFKRDRSIKPIFDKKKIVKQI